MAEFIPVLIGSDANVYGMARSFHEEYNLRSVALSKTVLPATANSKLIDFVFEPDLENDDKFVAALMKIKASFPDKKLLLIPCGDGYVKLTVKNQARLSGSFLFNCPSEEVMYSLSLKENFYQMCDKYGFKYPKTAVVSKNDYKTDSLGFDFPVVLKASNSVEYWKCSFNGKMKVFVAQNKDEYVKILNAIYSSSYQDHMTIQEFIPGDDSYMRVLNCYVGSDGKVKLMALGHALLEEHTPQGIGSYVAIINTFDEKLLEKFKFMLEDIGYHGFANFDMKFDSRDNEYKLFETNIRQGRSSYFVTASGYNLAKWLVDDLVYKKEMPLTIAKNEYLWLQVPKGIVRKYVKSEPLQKQVKELIKQGKWTNSLIYKKDLSLKRYIGIKLSMLNHYRKYKRYYGKKGLNV